MDGHIPWKHVERMYAIPEKEFLNINSFTIVDSDKSKWKKYRISEKPFNDSYRNLTVEDCPALRKDKFSEWLKLMREGE